MAEGKIEPPCEFTVPAALDFTDCGVVVTGVSDAEARGYAVANVAISAGHVSTPYDRTLIWEPSASLRRDLIPVGFERLAHGWQVAAPLASYRTLARDIGDDVGRKVTEEVIHDLRVPFYDVRVLFVRKCATTDDLLATYAAEQQIHPEKRLAFMRALYKVKPVLCALPLSCERIDITANMVVPNPAIRWDITAIFSFHDKTIPSE